ncbi:MAG: bifunctional precorrin-2 dehydrogenase/sirohydrochlorin ferrochelatase [Chloroflexota bacterium]|nr:bifunctional precorrin-2 dehydrogenase/sirohydrochlorin ferrochelatase [Chloroflexota bacterium]
MAERPSGFTNSSKNFGSSNGLYPVMLTPALLARRGTLVVGGGQVAERRVRTLLTVGARVRLIAAEICAGLKQLALESGGALQLEERPWQPEDVTKEMLLVFAATDSREVNQRIAEVARSVGCLVNLSDDPAGCDFTVPSTIYRDGITFALATGAYKAGGSPDSTEEEGAIPALTAHLRHRLQEAIGPEYDSLARLLRRFRPIVKARLPLEKRAAFWRMLVNTVTSEDSPLLLLLQSGCDVEAEALLRQLIEEELWKS